jgi:hypothetical protein
MKFINDVNLDTNTISKGSFEVVTTLPNTDLFVGRQVVYNNNIYIYTSNGWKYSNQITRKTSSQWETENPVLLEGEMGYDSTSKRYKIGDGVNTWKNLQYEIDTGVLSSGQQLIVNGNGILGDNTNFSQLVYDPTMSFNGSPGVFKQSADGIYSNTGSDLFIPIDTTKKYRMSIDIASVPDTELTYNYTLIAFYDIDKKEIKAVNHMYFQGSTTTLARDLKKGDTEIYVTDLSGFKQQSQDSNRAIIFWDYKNSYGYQYPKETYSRYYNGILWTNEEQLDYTNNKIILDRPWSNTEHLAGCDISQGSGGYYYKYLSHGYVTSLTHWTGVIEGVDYSGTNASRKFPPGVAYGKVGFLLNYSKNKNARTAISNIRLEEITEDLRYPLTLFNKTYNGTTSLSIVPSDIVGAMEDGSADITDNTEFITSNANGFNYSGSVNVPYRRKATYLWNWIKNKISSNAITTPGVIIPNGTASQVLLANGTTNTLKTVGGNTLLGSGDITFKTINNQALIGSGNISIEEDSHDVVLNDIDEDGLEWYLVPVCNDNVGIDNSNTTYLYAKNSTQPDENRFLYNKELNAISCNIYASDIGASIINVQDGKYIDFRDISNMLNREDITYIYSLDDFQSWLITLNGDTTAPTKSISTMISEEIAKVVSNAPASFDTLKEIADWISKHQNDASAMNTAINTNTTNITNLTTKVDTNTTNITSLTTKVNNNTTAINYNANDIKTLATAVDSLKTVVKELQEQNTALQNEINILKQNLPYTVAEDGFYVVDANGYVGFKVDNNGATDSATTIETTNLDE